MDYNCFHLPAHKNFIFESLLPPQMFNIIDSMLLSQNSSSSSDKNCKGTFFQVLNQTSYNYTLHIKKYVKIYTCSKTLEITDYNDEYTQVPCDDYKIPLQFAFLF